MMECFKNKFTLIFVFYIVIINKTILDKVLYKRGISKEILILNSEAATVEWKTALLKCKEAQDRFISKTRDEIEAGHF